jgi:L-ascorbate metabolism protein UlaG (beta-lactamase superfamily)
VAYPGTGSGRLAPKWSRKRDEEDTVKLTKYSHACVRIERDGAVLVIDPGSFSEREALDGVDAILITHEHVDHVDVDAVADGLARRPSARIYTNEAVAKLLTELDEVVTTVESGQAFEAAGFGVRAYGAWHAVIHPDLERVPNLGFLVEESVYHPGDSFDVPDVGVETLFVPVTAPWLKTAESIDFVRAVAPRRAYALHDSLANEAMGNLTTRLIGALGGAEFARLAPGTTVDV